MLVDIGTLRFIHDPVEFYNSLKNNVIVQGFLYLPVIFMIPFIWLAYFHGFENQPGNIQIIPYLQQVVLSGALLYFITGIPPFTIIGQAERYLEMICPFMAVLFFTVIINTDIPSLLFWLALGINFTFCCYNFVSKIPQLVTRKKARAPEGLNDLLKWMEKNVSKAAICTIELKEINIVSEFSWVETGMTY